LNKRILGLPNTSGVYMIKNILNGESYIGSATSLMKRANAHRCCLLNGNHANIKLQRSFNKNGGNCFIIGVIEFTSIENLINLETEMINKFKPFYNLRNVTKSNLGVKLSDETRKKMRDAKIGKKPHPNSLLALIKSNKRRAGNLTEPMRAALKKGSQSLIGKPKSEKTKQLISQSKIGKKFNKEIRKYEFS
jgi:group I intron endonuclease